MRGQSDSSNDIRFNDTERLNMSLWGTPIYIGKKGWGGGWRGIYYFPYFISKHRNSESALDTR